MRPAGLQAQGAVVVLYFVPPSTSGVAFGSSSLDWARAYLESPECSQALDDWLRQQGESSTARAQAMNLADGLALRELGPETLECRLPDHRLAEGLIKVLRRRIEVETERLCFDSTVSAALETAQEDLVKCETRLVQATTSQRISSSLDYHLHRYSEVWSAWFAARQATLQLRSTVLSAAPDFVVLSGPQPERRWVPDPFLGGLALAVLLFLVPLRKRS